MAIHPECTEWDDLQWRRRLETFGPDDGPALAAGSQGEIDGVCNLGELTDRGRATTLALGQRLRHLYVDQLGFMPSLLSDADMIYLRSTPIPRAMESVQQTFWGMYPRGARAPDFPAPTFISRTPADETLFPNDSNCRRFSQLSRAFGQRAADRWNNTPDMEYLNSLISKWMPEDSKRVAVDSHPRLSGIMDTINSTLAHPAPTRLPDEFYDKKGREIIEKIGVEEWFSGYKESTEYRALGIGAQVADVVQRMVGSVEPNANDGSPEIGEKERGRSGEQSIRMGLLGCHDTTLAAFLTSLGAFEGESWPPYSSAVAVELFRKAGAPAATVGTTVQGSFPTTTRDATEHIQSEGQGFWTRIFGSTQKSPKDVVEGNMPIARRRVDTLNMEERNRLDGYYVRLRYNDRVMKVPACRELGKNFEGDDSFCTLVGSLPRSMLNQC